MPRVNKEYIKIQTSPGLLQFASHTRHLVIDGIVDGLIGSGCIYRAAIVREKGMVFYLLRDGFSGFSLRLLSQQDDLKRTISKSISSIPTDVILIKRKRQ